MLRGDVDVNIISSLKVVSTTWTLHLEEAPEAFAVDAYDNHGKKCIYIIVNNPMK